MGPVETLALALLTALILASAALVFASRRANTRAQRIEQLESQAASLRQALERFQPITDVEAEAARAEQHHRHLSLQLEQQRAAQEAELSARRRQLEAEIEQARMIADAELGPALTRLQTTKAELAALDEQHSLIEHGLYQPHYDFESSDLYKKQLDLIRDQQKALIKQGRAAYGKTEFTIDGNKAKGRKFIKDTTKLMMRAFNGECDAAISKVKYNNVTTQQERIKRAYDAINKLGSVNHCEIANAYLVLRTDELRLAHEYAEKKQQEKEEQRRIKEQMREEQKALQEIEKAKQNAEKDEQRFEVALAKAREEEAKASGAKQAKLQEKLAALERQLAEAQQNKERALSRAQITKSGHVYVISNIGSFGESVYKIGMTRRLDPLDRVRELGDASVPFRFDVHAIIYCDDAPSLETKLHRRFHHRRVNRINLKREFFHVSLAEIETVVTEEHGVFEFTKLAKAEEFRKSVAQASSAGEVIHVPVRQVAPARLAVVQEQSGGAVRHREERAAGVDTAVADHGAAPA